MKKIRIISVVVIIVALLLWWFLGRNSTTNEPQWKTAAVDSGKITVIVTATGSLNAVTTVQVGAQVSGIVSKLYVDFNSVVTKGQLVAKLDTTLLYATMQDAFATMQKARVQMELTKSQFVRTDTLYKEKVASRADYELALSNYQTAVEELRRSKATYEHERTNLQYSTIVAPINGTVISRNVDVGQTVISSFNAPTLFTIANDLTQMQVLANVDEADIGQIKVGQETEFTVDAYPYDVFKGKVSMIRLQPIMVQNVNNYTVVIDVPNPTLKLLPGLTANITIKIDEHSNVYKVPINAIHFMPQDDYLQHSDLDDSTISRVWRLKVPSNQMPRVGDSCYIWLLQDKKALPHKVKLGLFDGNNIEVSGGTIKKDDIVIVGLLNATAAPVSTTANNPFMPKMPTRKTTR
jgi:HlyD family secretion protein